MTVTPGRDDEKPVIANLIQLYLYDMTGTMPFPVGADGRFEYGFLDRFWRFPYLIRSGEEIAGFALVIDQCPLTGRNPCFFMAEFFVMKAYRRRGLGRATLDDLVARHPGDWHIGVPQQNEPALAFWTQALKIRSLEIAQLAFEGDAWRLHSFKG